MPKQEGTTPEAPSPAPRERANEPKDEVVGFTPWAVLQSAIRAVPELKYALAVLGIVSAIAIVKSFGVDFRVAIFGTIVMLVLMAALVVFAALSKIRSPQIRAAALLLMWSSLVLTILSAAGLFLSTFFDYPKPIVELLQPILNGKAKGSGDIQLKLSNKELSEELEQILVPTFTDTLVNYGGATDGDYLDMISQVFAVKLSGLYTTSFVKMDPGRADGFEAAKQTFRHRISDTPYGVLVGTVHAYRDERPDIGQKAQLSIEIALHHQDGRVAWNALMTRSETSADPEGDLRIVGIEAMDLLNRISTELADKLNVSLR